MATRIAVRLLLVQKKLLIADSKMELSPVAHVLVVEPVHKAYSASDLPYDPSVSFLNDRAQFCDSFRKGPRDL